MSQDNLPDYVGVWSQPGSGKSRNADRYRILTKRAPLVQNAERGELFAVFDGMGSKQYGGEAAQAMCDLLVDFYKKPNIYSCSCSCSSAGLLEIFQTGNQLIYNWGISPNSNEKIGGCVGTVF